MRYSIYYPINEEWNKDRILIVDNYIDKAISSTIHNIPKVTLDFGWRFSTCKEKGDDGIHLLDTDNLSTVKLSLETIKENHPELFI